MTFIVVDDDEKKKASRTAYGSAFEMEYGTVLYWSTSFFRAVSVLYFISIVTSR